jgi:amidophosphoribosyltransferase
MPTSSELVAHGRTVEQLEKMLGADRLIFQDLADLEEAVRIGNPKLERFENSVFTGKYVTQDIDDAYLNQLELFRSDKAKEARRSASSTVIDLHNAANR